jgi:excisionase family DNA binding protein
MLTVKSPPTLKDHLIVKDAARLLGVNPTTLRRWDRKGKLKSTRHPINRYRLYQRKALEAFLTHLTKSR